MLWWSTSKSSMSSSTHALSWYLTNLIPTIIRPLLPATHMTRIFIIQLGFLGHKSNLSPCSDRSTTSAHNNTKRVHSTQMAIMAWNLYHTLLNERLPLRRRLLRLCLSY